MVRTSLIYFRWVGEPQLQIYQGVFILSIAKAFAHWQSQWLSFENKKRALQMQRAFCVFQFQIRLTLRLQQRGQIHINVAEIGRRNTLCKHIAQGIHDRRFILLFMDKSPFSY